MCRLCAVSADRNNHRLPGGCFYLLKNLALIWWIKAQPFLRRFGFLYAAMGWIFSAGSISLCQIYYAIVFTLSGISVHRILAGQFCDRYSPLLYSRLLCALRWHSAGLRILGRSHCHSADHAAAVNVKICDGPFYYESANYKRACFRLYSDKNTGTR